MRHSLFNGRADGKQVIGHIRRRESRSDGHHAAPDIHTYGSRNDCALGGNHGAYGGTHAPMDIRHYGHVLIYERHRGNIAKLLQRLFLEWNSFGPHANQLLATLVENVVVKRSHDLSPNTAAKDALSTSSTLLAFEFDFLSTSS